MGSGLSSERRRDCPSRMEPAFRTSHFLPSHKPFSEPVLTLHRFVRASTDGLKIRTDLQTLPVAQRLSRELRQTLRRVPHLCGVARDTALLYCTKYVPPRTNAAVRPAQSGPAGLPFPAARSWTGSCGNHEQRRRDERRNRKPRKCTSVRTFFPVWAARRRLHHIPLTGIIFAWA